MAQHPPSSSDRIPPQTRLGHVHLTVNQMEPQLMFYTQVLGFKLHWHKGTEAALGTEAEILLRLTENPNARHVQHTTGMYHFAVLYPNKKALARAIARLFVLRYPNSPTDHGVSKTTYLDDPEGNNIELYIRTLDDAQFDTENGQMIVRYADGRTGSGRDPLDLDALFSELDENERLDGILPEGTRIGHMHLYAARLEAPMNFYASILGFQPGPVIETFRMAEVALDEQQPHVIAWNTWKGVGLPPAPANAAGIRHFTIVLPDAAELQRVIARVQAAGLATEPAPEGTLVRDPSGISLILTDRMPELNAAPD
jgi:catechol 2,3-dioxygenase